MGFFRALNAVRASLAPKPSFDGQKSTSSSSVARPGVKVSSVRPALRRPSRLKRGTVACNGQRPSVKRVGLRAADLFSTNHGKPSAGSMLPGASKEQAKLAASLHKSFEEAAEGSKASNDLSVHFQEQVSLAEQCNLFSIWPFPDEQEGHSSSLYDIPALLDRACRNDRLAVFVPLLQRLFIALRSSRPSMTPHLWSTIETMVKCKNDTFSPEEVRIDLINILQPLQSIVQEVNHTSSAAVSNDATVSSQSSAAVQSAAEPPPEQSTPDHQQLPESVGVDQQGEDDYPSEDFSRKDKTEDFGPHVFAAYRLVMDGPSTDSAQVSLPEDQLLRQRSLLRGMRVHDSKLSLKAYAKRHTNVFRFEFNQRMSEKRRMREAGWDADARTLSVDEDTSDVLSDVTCPAVGLCGSFQEHDDVSSGLGVVDDEDPYLG